MAYIKTLKDNEFIGGTDNTDVYPVTTTQAIFSQSKDGTVPAGIKHQRLEDRLQDHEEDAEELHQKAEKLVLTLDVDKAGQVLEIINGQSNAVKIEGSAAIEVFGDAPSQTLDIKELTNYNAYSVYSTASTAISLQDRGTKATGSYTLPNVVGTHTINWNVTYNGITKTESKSVYVNLRKYFGFVDSVSDITSMLGSQFSNSVSCTITVPRNGSGFKYIYFAVPQPMVISRIVQPDALNAVLTFESVGSMSRAIGSSSYTYNIYRSTDKIDCSVDKRLTLS